MQYIELREVRIAGALGSLVPHTFKATLSTVENLDLMRNVGRGRYVEGRRAQLEGNTRIVRPAYLVA